MNTKDIIIDAARELFSKYGYKKVSMDEIALKANVTKKTVYSYFNDKDSLFLYFVHEELEVMKKKVEKEKVKSNNFTEFVSNSLYDIMMHRKKCELINNMFFESKEQESKTRKFLEVYEDEIIKYIESLINEQIENRVIRKCNANLIAFIMYRMYLDVLFDYNGEVDPKEAANEISIILNNGILNK